MVALAKEEYHTVNFPDCKMPKTALVDTVRIIFNTRLTFQRRLNLGKQSKSLSKLRPGNKGKH